MEHEIIAGVLWFHQWYARYTELAVRWSGRRADVTKWCVKRKCKSDGDGAPASSRVTGEALAAGLVTAVEP